MTIWSIRRNRSRLVVALLVATAVPGGATPPARVDVTDACTFIPRAQLEAAVGWELREGKPRTAPAGASECDFATPPQMYVTRTFPNPPLPPAAGFSSIVVNTHPSDATRFAEFRRQLGARAEEVSGLGDAAYFHGPNLLYVRVGTHGFSVRVYVNEPRTDAGRAALRTVMLNLGRLGVARLR
jgi:hypothetical protein